MRGVLLAVVMLCVRVFAGQVMAQNAVSPPASVDHRAVEDRAAEDRAAEDRAADLKRAMTGIWVGTLEYRDYSEPVGSTKRVKLPTWLTVPIMADGALRFRYVYDDGPAKTVTETSVVRINSAAARYEAGAEKGRPETGKVQESYAIDGLAGLKQGRGVLTLTGPGIENKAPVSVKTTLRVGRNILEMTRETAAAGEAMTFRHTYTFVRAAAPAVANIAEDEPE